MDLVEKDLRYLWHPFTQHQVWGHGDSVLVIDRAEGFHLIDVDGKRYLDGVSSLWCNVHGHRVPELDDAIRQQLDRVAHSTLLGLSQTQAILLAEELIAVAPKGLSRVFYSDAGATAVEIALKMAVQFWQQSGAPQKRKLLTLAEAYHGDTVGALSLGFSSTFHKHFRHLAFDVIQVPPGGDATGFVHAISQNASDLAAVCMEPVMQGAAGMLAQPPGYLRAIADACRAHDVLLICDEVATGLGRTGALWACDTEGVTPDLMCVAKGLSGGYLPVAATLTTERIFRAFLGAPAEAKTFFHGHTFTGNALGCAVARASLKLLVDKVMPTVPQRVAKLTQALEPLRALPHVVDVRQRGFMVGIELARNTQTREPYPAADRMGHRVCMEARKHGVIIRPLGNVVVLMPAPAMPEALLQQLVDVTAVCIRDITGGA